MQKNNGAVKHNELVLCKTEVLEYPGGSVAEVQPMYQKVLPSGKSAILVGLSCLDHLVLSSLDEKPVSIRERYPSLFEH